MTPTQQSTMRAWQYSAAGGGIEKNLKLNAGVQIPKPTTQQHVVKVIAISINPADYKPVEIPVLGRLLVPNPGTPGMDFAGRIVAPAVGSELREGQVVFGAATKSPFGIGALSEYAATDKRSTIAIPDGVAPIDAATLPVCALTAYQTIQPYVKAGDRVFINAGSGGTGVYGIQMAKALGCHVTTTCSAANIDLCKRLGADDVIDYRKGNVVESLKAVSKSFDHVVDNAGHNNELYYRCHEYTTPNAVYVMVAGTPSLAFIRDSILMRIWPSILGGGRRKIKGYLTDFAAEDLRSVINLMKEGKIKAVIDSRFPFEQVPHAFEKLKTGRAKGKVMVEVDLMA